MNLLINLASINDSVSLYIFSSPSISLFAYAYTQFPLPEHFIYLCAIAPHRARAHNHSFSRASSWMPWNKPIKCITSRTRQYVVSIVSHLYDAQHIWRNNKPTPELLCFHWALRSNDYCNWEKESGYANVVCFMEIDVIANVLVASWNAPNKIEACECATTSINKYCIPHSSL